MNNTKLSANSQTLIDIDHHYNVNNYHPLPVVIAKGEGAWLWDVDGKRYLDMMSAYSAVSHGHSHPKIIDVLQKQAQTLNICSRAFYNDQLPLFLKKLCQLLNYERAVIMNSGAEAVETAIKAMRRWGYQKKGIEANQAEIIVTSNNFHGRTIGIISFSSDDDYKQGFGPFLPGFKLVPFGDIQAIQKAITPNTCGILTEPIQGEAGIVLPPKNWLKNLREICDQNNVLMAVDEIQSGLGRTGKMLACEHESVKPNIVILGKSLGGGILPVSAVVGTDDVLSVFNPGSHGSTFGGNSLASAVASKALDVLVEEDLCARSTELGEYFLNQLRSTIQSPMVTDIRGLGLWIGIEFSPSYVSARTVAEKLIAEGILTKETHDTVIRLAPPLVIEKKSIDWCLTVIKKVIQDLEQERV